MVDWNEDGKKDVLCGDHWGRVYLMINAGTDANPLFQSADLIQDGGEPLFADLHSSPCAVDFNRDGKKDLVVGNTNGFLRFYENKGTDPAPVFDGFVELSAGNEVIDVGECSRPVAVDWDEDGVLDLLSGSSPDLLYTPGTVLYYHSLGPLSFDTNQILANTGGSVQLSLDAGSANAGRSYLICGSITGTWPGTPLPGGQATLAVNWDLFSDLVWILINTAYFQNFMGSLDGSGKAEAVLSTQGALPQAAGLVMSFAYALNNPWDFASNGGTIEIVP
ncbi:MAG: FG-GAP repeat domain-containing protein [Planctomycetota bacterium]